MKTGPFHGTRGEQSDEALKEATLRFARTLSSSINEREELRSFIHTLATWLAEETRPDARDRAAAPHPDADDASSVSGAPVDGLATEGASSHRTSTTRTTTATAATTSPASAGGRQHTDTGTPVWKAAEYSSFDTIERRSLLKAEAARWKVEKRRLEAQGDEAEPAITTYDSLIDRAKALPNCYLWMLQWQSIPDDDAMHDVAACYDNLASMARGIAAWLETRNSNDEPEEEMLLLAAEAQSALRAALLRADFQDDRDQNDVFFWLREQAEMYGIYIARFMRKSDQADPRAWRDLRARITAWNEARDRMIDNEKRRVSIINTVSYHVRQLVDHGFDEADEDHHWNRIFQSCVAWADAGLNPEDAELCRCVIPVFDQVPEDLDIPQPAEDVFRVAEDLADASDRADDSKDTDDTIPDEDGNPDNQREADQSTPTPTHHATPTDNPPPPKRRVSV